MNSKLQDDIGRINQKRKTRLRLLAAAVQMIETGVVPTVSELADHAEVSRATAYRYFQTQESLLLAASLHLNATREIEKRLTLVQDADDVKGRVQAVTSAINAVALANEAAFRAFLRVSLDPAAADPPRRTGERLRVFAEALAPARDSIDERTLRHLSLALSLCVGIEAMVILKDICGLDGKEAEAEASWAAGVLVDAVLRERS